MDTQRGKGKMGGIGRLELTIYTISTVYKITNENPLQAEETYLMLCGDLKGRMSQREDVWICVHFAVQEEINTAA